MPRRRTGRAPGKRRWSAISSNADIYRVMLGENGVPAFSKRMKRAIEEAFYRKFAASNSVPDIPPKVLGAYVASAHFGLIEWWLENDLAYSPAYMAGPVCRMIRSGTGPEASSCAV